MQQYLAYVGIDFGTSGSTFSYWLPKSSIDKESIKVKSWAGAGTANKMETEIILDENFNKILAFGKNQCEQFIKKSQQKFLYFSNVKMFLYKNQFQITDNYSNKKYDLIKVISKFLEKLRDEAINELKSKQKSFMNKSFEECLDSIKWIITVPAIWSEQNKTCMIQAAKLAKLIKDSDDPSNFFALEPEGAACYFSMSDNAEKEIFDNPYIICDIGGGTTDITTHERIIDEQGKYYINELYPPIGGANGSREINRYILEQILVQKIFSQKAFDKIQEKIKIEEEENYDLKEDMRKINEDINKFKETFDLKNIDAKYKIKFDAFKDGFENEPNIEELVKNYNDNIKEDWKIGIKSKKSWILELPYKIVYDLFKELIIDKATAYIQKIIENLKKRNSYQKEIKSVILAGGATANLSVIDLFRKSLPNLFVVSVEDPEIAVVKGAIYFAKNPFSISKRLARFSLGIRAEGSWNEKFEHVFGALKFYDEERKKFLCLNRFIPFYKKYQSIDVTKDGIKRKFGMNSEHCNLEFYKSDFDGPVYIVAEPNEKEKILTEKFGILEFTVKDFDEKEPDVEIEIKLGGTFISAKIVYLKTKESFYKSFNFN